MDTADVVHRLSTAQTGFTAQASVHALRVKACKRGQQKAYMASDFVASFVIPLHNQQLLMTETTAKTCQVKTDTIESPNDTHPACV